MKLKNTSYIFLMLFFFGGCSVRKSVVEYKERVVRDTISIYKERLVTKQIIDTLLIENPCDSVGKLKQFEKEIKTEKAQITLKSVNGKIEVAVNLDSIINQKEKEFIASYKKEVEIKKVEIVRYKFPLWLILTALLSIILNLFFIKSKLPF
tara:strand:+ start:1532 stop:1984 length:453 start_codon:yes stop_codon:yes gene_type:complete